MGFDSQGSVTRELVLYGDNTGELYPRKQAARLMLLKHACRGTFDEKKAVKGMRHFADEAARRYGREHDTPDQPFGGFTPTDRTLAATEWVREFVRDVRSRHQTGDLLDAERRMLDSPRCKLPKGW